jgi:hypothetical protein
MPARDFPTLISPPALATHPADGDSRQANADAATVEYARAVFQSFAFAPERWALRAAQFGEGVSKKELSATDFAVGYKVR